MDIENVQADKFTRKANGDLKKGASLHRIGCENRAGILRFIRKERPKGEGTLISLLVATPPPPNSYGHLKEITIFLVPLSPDKRSTRAPQNDALRCD